MRLFRNKAEALKSLEDKKIYYLNSYCPHQENKLCGSWCAKFYYEEGGDHTSAFVILGCKAGEKNLYVEDVVGE